ncbi:MAG: hypothetical protein NXI07_11875 [bacterium]|nr:hypothetical protein [bacterium]
MEHAKTDLVANADPQVKKPRNSRAFTILAFVFALIAIVYLYSEYAFQMRIRNFYAQNESRMIETLSSADSFDALAAQDGVMMFGTPAGPWVAMMYTDSHGNPFASIAIAQDSSGNWYYSEHHFCGAFSAYLGPRESIRKVEAELDGWSFGEEDDQEYIELYLEGLMEKPWWNLDHASSESDIHDTLEANHFVPFEP